MVRLMRERPEPITKIDTPKEIDTRFAALVQ